MQIGEVASFQNGYAFKSKDFVQDGKYKIIKIKELKDGKVRFFNDSASVNVDDERIIEKYIVEKEDILFALTGDPVNKNNPLSWVGRVSVYEDDQLAVLNQRVCKLVPKKGLNAKYIYYYFRAFNNFYALASIAKGSASQANISTKDIEAMEIALPSLNIQNKIVSVLDSIEEKINQNNKINKNLEQQAQAIFKAWFVDFEAFDGEMPDDWIVSKLSDIASIKTNSFSPVKNPDAQLEHYSIPAYDEQKYPVFESAAGVKSNKYILSKNSVMISKLNPDTKRVWRPMCLSELAVSSTEFIIFEAFNPAYRDFVFSVIDSAAFSDWMCAHTTGSTNSRQRTTPSATLEFQVALPDEKTITDFCAIVTPMYDTISANICENQKLAQLRDSILPRLMSGELDVSDLDI